MMDRIRSLLSSQSSNEGEYAPLQHEEGRVDVAEETSFLEGESIEETPFSWLEYFSFAMLGVAMLWAWYATAASLPSVSQKSRARDNQVAGHVRSTLLTRALPYRNMFMAAAPYFKTRFASNDSISSSFQSAILAISTTTNLGAMLLLTKLQRGASYPYRIHTALLMNITIFAVLTASTRLFLDASPPLYLAFILATVATSAWATGLLQNGAFAFAASWGRPEYMQAIMAGQGVAGVLPSLAQMLTVLLLPPSSASPEAPQPRGEQPPPVVTPPPPKQEAGAAAFVYFLTAVVVSVATLVAFQPLVRRHNRLVESRMTAAMAESMNSVEEAERAARKVVGLWDLLKKLRWVAGSVFMCFVVTMFFPVFTTKVLSVNAGDDGDDGGPRIFRPEVFIPLAFFFWNFGDLLGRMSTMLPFSLRHRPAALFAIALARWLFLPLYFLCNIGGRGAVVKSDLFYLLLVQFPFGLTNGWLGSNSMMAAGEWVDDGEREASGGFMGLCLTAGLAVGSVLSFSAANA